MRPSPGLSFMNFSPFFDWRGPDLRNGDAPERTGITEEKSIIPMLIL